MTINKNGKPRKKRTKVGGHKVDHDQFINKVDRNISYILGFLWADGNIHKNSIRIELKKEDILDILPIFKTVGSWNYYERQRMKDGQTFGKMQASLQTSNGSLTDFLKTMDYGDKTVGPSKILEHIGSDYHVDFWHGFFDGDGSLYVEDKCGGSVSLQFWSSIDQNWKPLISYLDSINTFYKIWKYERIKPNGKIHKSSCLGVKNTQKIEMCLEHFYNTGLIGLNRKYQKFLLLKDKSLKKTKKYPTTGGGRYYN